MIAARLLPALALLASAAWAQAPGNYILLTVADSGCGIPNQYLPMIFERYFRVPGDTSQRGSGLGLAIVREIVTAHGGTVECESQPGETPMFRMSLPVWTGETAHSPLEKDDEVHRRFTGVGSQLILENLARLSGAGAAVIARIPLIPGINDHDANLEAAAGFLTSHTRITEVHLLPFHQTGDEKSFRLGREALPIGLDPPSDDRVREAAALFEHHGLHVSIGG